MKTLELKQMENLEGGKFWGWSDWTPTGPCTNGFQTVSRHYDVLWINTGVYEYNVVSC
ncbi:hypothetical protein [Flavobacterium sp.]|uniref:hypothetical protein n=1 Tax=Flavobacterium sp. TaxID=239 RepID=UPI0022CC57C5|nr:hypothetical protein [Flavobacterium sp.]MCZ8169242.1 hypothetical protein [Flavobacterium sp.]MCZ8296773.1 hypothetical protein [Flavobacterium sp.]